MTNRRDVDRLSDAQRELVRRARTDLASLLGSLDLTRPEAARDALVEIVPMLVREYGNVAATAAAEWYEDVRPGTWNARTAESFPLKGVERGVRYHAGHLFGGDPADTVGGLSGAIQRYITYSGRQTIARNVELDPLRPRYGRVPSGAHTCAWCAFLSSRGFVYRSERSAGINDSDFHDDCDCQIVASFDAESAHIDGYDPDHFYDMYRTAQSATGAADDREIAAAMRDMFPDEFTDGHVH